MSNTELQTPKITALPTATVRVTEARPLDAADAIAIHELINRVYLAEDSRDHEALQQVVTEDYVQRHSLYGSLEGREAFTSFVLDNPTYFDGLRHQAFTPFPPEDYLFSGGLKSDRKYLSYQNN
jgi:hypothetical protein